ncbi:MAG: putative arabinose efflux permease, family [Streptosporangiaceae bacterium]|nr:putative arabinose efflux permease, family [Streptosporangiaceae bacterium]
MGTALVLLVEDRTGRAAGAGFLLSAALLPYVVSGPIVGDGLDRTGRPGLRASVLAAAYTVAVALLLALAGNVPTPVALAAAVAVGCLEPVGVALSGLLPRIVPEGRLTRAYGLESASYNVAGIAGPGLVAALAAWAGPQSAGLVVVTFAALGAAAMPLLALTLPTRKGTPAAGAARPGRRRAEVLTGGAVVLFGNRPLRAVTVATVLAFAGIGGVPVVAVLLAGHLGAGPAAGGQLLVAFAAGALAGSLASARRLKQRGAEWVVLGAITALGLTLAGAALAAPSLAWAVAWFAAAGVCDGPLLAATLILRQRESPADRLGQVNTTGGGFKLGAAAVGAALTGVLADALGAGGLLLGMAGLQFTGAAAGLVLLRR